MEKNFKITMAYDGTGYHGFQLQPDVRTIQSELERSLSKIFQSDVKIYGAGRTDAGVHATGQVAHFMVDTGRTSEQLQRALNGLVPSDIVIKKVEEVSSDFHARYSAKSRLYRYTILNRPYPDVFLRNFVFFYRYPLDIESMIKATSIFKGSHDFTSFCAAAKEEKNNTRVVMNFNLYKWGDFIITDIEASGFLHNMVRILMGTILQAGRGKYSFEKIRDILEARDRTCAGPTLPARGLCLVCIKY